MNETLELIANRYTCRSFSAKTIDEKDLRLIVEAGIQAPSGMNVQPWFFVVVTDPEVLADLDSTGMARIAALPDKTFYERMQSRGGKLLYDAPCAVLIAIDTAHPRGYEKIDLGIAAENIVLAAASLGISSCHHASMQFAFQGTKGVEFSKRLKFPEGYEFGLAVLLGYDDRPSGPHAPDQSKIAWV